MDIRYDVTIGGLLWETAARYPNRPAVRFMGQTWTWEETRQAVIRIGYRFLKTGIGKGDHIGLWAGDRPHTFLTLMALTAIGAVPVFLNASWHPKEVRRQVDAMDLKGLFYDAGVKDLDFEAEVAAFDRPDLVYERIDRTDTEDEPSPEQVQAVEAAIAQVRPSDPDMILFTSGTTSAPKGVVTTHFSRVNIGYAQAEMIDASCDDVYCVALPMFHCFSMGGNVMAALAVGACLAFPKDRHTQSIFTAVQEAGCTVLTAVPTLFSAMLANPDRNSFDLHTLRTGLVGGAPCPEDILNRVQQEFGMTLLPSLGQSEATAGITCGRVDDSPVERAQTVGYLIPHVEGRITDIRSGAVLPEGETGELCIRGYNVMQGYYGMPEETEKAIDGDGFLHTGDMGYIDRKGLVHLTGRLKELIIRGGENIAPQELEQVISREPGAALVKVIGVPDHHYGEQVCACIQPEPGAILSPNEIRERVGAELASYKIPAYVLFFEEIPLLFNGKVDVVTLKDQAKQLVQACQRTPDR